MKKLLYLFLLLLPVLGFAQSRYGVEGVPMCWTTSLGVDSSIIRYVLVSTTGQPVKTIVHENANGVVVNVSGGTLRYGFCDCAGGALDSLANGSVTWAKLASAVKDSIKHKRDTFITVPPNTNYFQNTILNPARLYNNIYLSCKGRTDTSIVAFLASPVFEEQKGVVYHIKNDSGLVAAFVITSSHLSNNKRFYLLKRGQTAQVRLLPDAANPGQYGWAVDVVWDSIGGGNGIISALPLGNVGISTSNTLTITKNEFDDAIKIVGTDYKTGIGKYGIKMEQNPGQNLGGFLYWNFRNSNNTYLGHFNLLHQSTVDYTNLGRGPQLGLYGETLFGGVYQYISLLGIRFDTTNSSVNFTTRYTYGYFGGPAKRHRFISAMFTNNVDESPFEILSTNIGNRKIFTINNSQLTIRNNGKFMLSQDSSFVHDPTADSTLFKGSSRFLGSNIQVRIGKSEYSGNGNIETSIDASSRYNASWASRFVVNPYGYVNLINVENNGDNPRFYFYNSRGTSESAKVRSNVNDYVGFINFAPYNGSAYHNGAVIGTSISANSAGTSGTRFSQTMFFGIDKGGNSPQVSSNWVLALDSIRAYIPKNLQVGGVINGSSATFFVNNQGGGNIGVNTVTPTSKFHLLGSLAQTVTTISSATTLGEHGVVFATGASSYLVTLPAASSCSGRRYIIKVNGGAKTISSYLDLTGSTSTTLTNNTVLTLVSDGSNWQQI